MKRAITGAEKAMARSRKRAEKGLCTKEESDDFCAKSEAALRSYLDKQVESGVITPAERSALGQGDLLLGELDGPSRDHVPGVVRVAALSKRGKRVQKNNCRNYRSSH
ncbi:MAG: hypothetical protein II121_04570, partial [Fibrobacter sp.]|nr:hypothetical protein [Fibrobacter sp.]